MHTLSRDERQTLIAIVVERYGTGLSHEAFAEVMLGLSEDISGFETIPPAKANRIVLNLWSTYHGQEASKT